MIRYCAIFALTSLLGCALNSAPSAPRISYFAHKVHYQGETLGQISSWYTGRSANWLEIKKHNAGLDPKKIRVGDTILIPETMVIRRTDLPRPQLVTAVKVPEVESVAPSVSPEPLVDVSANEEIPDVVTRTEPLESIPQTEELKQQDSEERAMPATADAPVELPQVPAAIEQPPLAAVQAVPVKHIPSREALWEQLLKEE